MENLLVDKSVKRVNFLLSKCNFSFLVFILFLYCIDNLESKCEDAEFSLDYELSPFFLRDSRASETRACVGWFPCALAFRSLYYPRGKMEITRSLSFLMTCLMINYLKEKRKYYNKKKPPTKKKNMLEKRTSELIHCIQVLISNKDQLSWT